jgi:molybdopterin converting factor small subunit
LIKVRLLGHIKTSVGTQEVSIPDSQIEVGALVERLRSMSKEKDPGFNEYNTLAMIEDGEAFVPASRSKTVTDGQSVVLIPFSHGG